MSRFGKTAAPAWARSTFGGIVKNVCLAYVPEVMVGDYTIVHVGFAISRIDEESAQKTLQTFRDLGVLDDEFASEEKILKRAADAKAPECPSCKASPEK